MRQRGLAGCFAGVLCCLILAGCSARQMGREFDEAFGSLAREHVENLGSPGRGYSLIRHRFSNDYAVVAESGWILRFSEDFIQVRVVKQFVEGNKDYAILACTRTDGSLKNVLLVMAARPSRPSDVMTYNLDSDPTKPFFVDATESPTKLIQETDAPATIRVWWIENGLRGPATVSVAENQPDAEKAGPRNKQGGSSRPATDPTPSIPSMPLPPPVNPTATVRMEKQDTAGQSSMNEPRPAKAKPVIVLDPQPVLPAAQSPGE